MKQVIKAAENVVYTNCMKEKLFSPREKKEALLVCLQNNF